ncbi:aminopeptidase [Limnobacter parvus]|uniref:Aminopeptidase n=1 Tax=Limnobacter parvus TaxID=2939690 RepID=A0ABT1XJ00_9BURK|nr:aminopeptidase [Limnobacter parvus]MCR2746074.1 aminopeptidase [Limnobacter parvus]
MSALVFLNACSTGAYFWQATTGHLQVLAASEKIDRVLLSADTSEKLRTQLQYVQDIRKFSIEALALPDNRSYTTYADLNRPYVVWNVIASPVDGLNLKTWCFPFTGCISYKGFYQERDALELGNQLKADGLDVAVLGVPAYSTLGFTPDPVLNTFINYPAGELARLIFHELAHQVVYIADDTMFNESFATAVEELGVTVWLAQPGRADLKLQYENFDQRRVAFRALLAQAQADLKVIYENKDQLRKDEVLDAKKARFDLLRADYGKLKASWGGWAGYDRFMAEDLNNAKLGVSGLYTNYVPAFKALFLKCDGSFPRFYAAVEALGELPADKRNTVLDNLVDVTTQNASTKANSGTCL